MDVAVHTLGFLADTDEAAASLYYPSYAETMNRIGLERGWPPSSRAQFDRAMGPAGSLMVGSPESVARKIRSMDAALGGLSRVTIKLDDEAMPHERLLRAVELLGTRVKPMLEAVTA